MIRWGIEMGMKDLLLEQEEEDVGMEVDRERSEQIQRGKEQKEEADEDVEMESDSERSERIQKRIEEKEEADRRLEREEKHWPPRASFHESVYEMEKERKERLATIEGMFENEEFEKRRREFYDKRYKEVLSRMREAEMVRRQCEYEMLSHRI